MFSEAGSARAEGARLGSAGSAARQGLHLRPEDQGQVSGYERGWEQAGARTVRAVLRSKGVIPLIIPAVGRPRRSRLPGELPCKEKSNSRRCTSPAPGIRKPDKSGRNDDWTPIGASPRIFTCAIRHTRHRRGGGVEGSGQSRRQFPEIPHSKNITQWARSPSFGGSVETRSGEYL